MAEAEAAQVLSPRTPESAGVPDVAAPSPEAVQRRLSLAGSTPWQGRSTGRESVCDTGGHLSPRPVRFHEVFAVSVATLCGTCVRFLKYVLR